MRTVKLVVAGPSSVGKTSLRNQYISGQFTTGYRATIGADFITKTLPHHSRSGEFVTLQIWDTAGQERFSSLSSAFFRGADAVILMFDVNKPETLEALRKWWADFKDKAPVAEDEEDKFCCVVVGNKIDLSPSNPGSRISEVRAQRFMDELIPPGPVSEPPTPDLRAHMIPPPLVISEPITPESEDSDVPILPLSGSSSHQELSTPNGTVGIDIIHQHHVRHHRGRTKSASRSRSRSTIFRGGTIGTMTTTHTVYHTPSSSLFDSFDSARASPALVPSTPAHSQSRSPSLSPTRGPRRVSSASSTSSIPTITPSLFIRRQTSTRLNTACTTPAPIQAFPPRPERHPKLLFTSAKTGEGVSDVFEYIAERVVTRWEYEEAVEARTLHMQEASLGETIRLGHHKDRPSWLRRAHCCKS